MTIIARKEGEKFETIKKTDFELEDKLQKLIVDDQIMKKIKLGFNEDTTLVTLSREFESGSGPMDVLAIDELGDIYIIETKLHGYADGRRKILAQIMDYAGSMWHQFSDFTIFEEKLLRHNSTSKLNHILSGKTLSQIISDSTLGFTDNEDVDDVINNMKENFISGEFKFIVVFDKLDSKLINTIKYINKKSSIDIFAVTYEYYTDNGLEILLPSIYGPEAASQPTKKSSSRIPWTLDEIKQNFKNNFTEYEYTQFTELFKFLDKTADDINTGKGKKGGAISPVFNKLLPKTGTRGSFLTLDVGGNLTINYPWLKSEYRKNIANSFSENLELKIDNKSRSLSDIDLNTEYPKYSRDQWSQNIDSIIETIKKFI